MASASPHDRPLSLDFASGELRCGQARVRLRRKSLAVLRYLAEHPGRLVTKDELLEAVWPDTYVTDGVLKVCVAELRKALREALGPAVAGPDLLVTLHGQGYRLDLPAEAQPPVRAAVVPAAPTAAAGAPLAAGSVVGREAELRQLAGALASARAGERQVVFVTGEAGIGKTTLVEAFLASLETLGPDVGMGRGQCVQRYGTGEALMPLLEALGQLNRAPQAARLTAVLRRRAPAWVAELLDLSGEGELDAGRRPGAGTTLDAMLRVLVEALEAASGEAPLVLVLEDLHWADPSTVDFISTFAERRERARLVLLGTYRDVDAQATGHPLRTVKPHLLARRRCVELRLAPLGEAAICAYLACQLGGERAPAELARFLHRWTEGNPLFLASLLDYLTAQGALTADADGWHLAPELLGGSPRVPETVQELIERQFAQLDPPLQRLLEVASVAGFTFSSQALAVESGGEEVDARCHELVRRGQFLRAEGVAEWPDGTLGTRYAFIHSMYQVALYERLVAGRRRELHQRIGERLEAGFGAHADDIAAELAAHFERSRDAARAARYLAAAAREARRRAAAREAIGYLERERAVIPRLADPAQRAERELGALVMLAGLRMVIEGTTPEVGAEYERALELCAHSPRADRHFSVLAGLHAFCLTTAQLARARAIALEMLALAETGASGATPATACVALGLVEYPLGELVAAREHLQEALRCEVSPQLLDFVDVRVLGLGALAQVHAHLGDAALALATGRQARALARELGTPFNVLGALYHETGVHLVLGDARAALACIEEQLALLLEHGFRFFVDKVTVMRGWALVQQGQVAEGTAFVEQGLRACDATEQRLARPHFLALLAEAYAAAGDVERALGVTDSALVQLDATGERRFDPEVYCVRAQVLLAVAACGGGDRGAEAKACYGRAIAAARRQSARTYELRAALGLARLWQREKRCADARQLLAPLVATFTDGVRTADLETAALLLGELGGSAH